jgi:replicative DNA helicase
MIDNLQKFVRGTDNIPQKTAEAVSVLKDLAVDLKIPILLISHITKRPTGSTQAISMHDAKSSSTIYQDADMVLVINVKQDKSYEFIVDKNRMGEGGLSIPVVLNKDFARYYETDAMPKKVETKSNAMKSNEFD